MTARIEYSRRSFLATTALTGVAAASAGCLDDESVDARAKLGVDPDELTDVRFTQWPGAFREAAETAYVDPFTELADVVVDVFDHPVEVERLPELVIAGQHTFDLVSHWNYTLPAGVEGDAFHPIRTENVPNLERVSPEFDPETAGYDPGDAIHHVPYSIGGNVLVYNTEEMDEPESWERLLDADLAGDLWMPRTPSMLMGILARHAGLSLGDVEGSEEKIWDLVEQYDDIVDRWWTDPSALDAALADGRATAAGYWSGRAYALQQAGHPIDFTIPEEGTNAWIEVLSIPADVPEPVRRTGEAIANFAMRDETIVDFADEIGYAVAYDVDDDAIPAGHIYQDHPTWDLIGTGRLEVWDADVIAPNEERWDATLADIIG